MKNNGIQLTRSDFKLSYAESILSELTQVQRQTIAIILDAVRINAIRKGAIGAMSGRYRVPKSMHDCVEVENAEWVRLIDRLKEVE